MNALSEPVASTWVLLRGLTRDARHWGDFPARLEATLPGARAVAIDLPGNGRLHRERSPASVPAMADFARAELVRRGIAGPVHLLGMSLGGMVAVDWASRHPQELAGLVLITTSLAPFNPFWQRLRPGNYGPLLRLPLGRPDAAAWEAAVLRLTSRRHRGDAALLQRWTAWREAQPVSARNALRQLLAAARYRAPWSAPPVPTLVLGSHGDGLVHPSCSVDLAARWGCALAMHPDAGHDLPLDDPEWVLAQIVRNARTGAAAVHASNRYPTP